MLTYSRWLGLKHRDRWISRPVAAFAFGLFPLAAFALYFGPEETLALVWVPFIFLLTGGNVLMKIIATRAKRALAA